MPGHRPVVLDTWPRRPHFEHYLRQVPCTFSLTVELDVTDFAAALADSPLKTYPAQIWALATVVNRHEEFRMFVDDDGTPAVWDVVHPSLTVFNPERETFASVWVPYATDVRAFHRAAADLLATYRSATELFPQGDPPPNTFDVSSLPWTTFTGFTLDIRDGHSHLAPIVTLGRYTRRDGRTIMPVAPAGAPRRRGRVPRQSAAGRLRARTRRRGRIRPPRRLTGGTGAAGFSESGAGGARTHDLTVPEFHSSPAGGRALR